ncbi:MAG TPA: hypothetical protein PKC70_07445, partial [Cellvibrionaceae bacterium]|nr:hypothetical protein [Cellvibrionaceae bacterium]
MTATPLLSAQSLSAQLKATKQRKGEIARQFKTLTAGTPEHHAALAAMQAITAELKALEADITALSAPQAPPEPQAK